MPTFPSEFQAVINPYVRLFSRRVFAHAQLLLLGAILAPGKRTVTAALEVTFAQVRAHLGVETQRQWTDLAIARTTPVLLGLFSLVTLLAARLHAKGLLRAQVCAWYEKAAPTFSDALAAVRRYLWAETVFNNSPNDTIRVKIPRHQLHIWQEALAWAA